MKIINKQLITNNLDYAFATDRFIDTHYGKNASFLYKIRSYQVHNLCINCKDKIPIEMYHAKNGIWEMIQILERVNLGKINI